MDKRYEYYKEQYFFELERKNQLASNLSIPIGFLTIIFTACAYFALNINCIINHWSVWIFLGLILIALFFIYKASKYLYKSFVGLIYGYNPSPQELYEYECKHKNDKDLDEKFIKGIKLSFINNTARNRLNNNARANNLYNTNLNTIKAIIFIILSSVPFFIGKNVYDYKSNLCLTKNQIIMVDENEVPSEHQDLPSDPDTSDFPKDELIKESLDIDIEKGMPDSILPQTESDKD